MAPRPIRDDDEVQDGVADDPGILVRGTTRTWDLWVLAVLGVVSALAGLLMLPQLGVAAAVFIAGGVILAAAAVVTTVVRSMQRAWLVVTSDGFIYRDKSGEHAYRDDDIACFAPIVKSVYSGGVLQGVDRTLVVWVQNENVTDRLTIYNRIKLHAEDPLGDWIARIAHSLHQAGRRVLESGGVVEGENWTLSPEQLSCTVKGKTATIPVDEISAVAEVENHYCIWRRGDDRAALRIPVRSPNAHLLFVLLHEQLPPNSDEVADGELGRIVYERKPSRVIAIVTWILAGFLACAGLCMGVVSLAERNGGIFVVGLLVLLLGGLIGFVALYNQSSRFSCHAQGVKKTGLFGTRQLLYEDVDTFTYSAVRQYYNGVYTGTVIQIKLAPAPETGEKPISYMTTVRNEDEAMDALRDHISNLVAARLYRRVRGGKTARWGNNTTIRSDGIEHRPAGLFRRAPPVQVPFSQIDDIWIQAGRLDVTEKGRKKSRITLQSAEPNFFPGLLVVQQFLADLERGGAGDAEAGAPLAESAADAQVSRAAGRNAVRRPPAGDGEFEEAELEPIDD